MTRKKALERWEAKIISAEITPQAIWPIAKSLLKRDGTRAPTAIHGATGLKFHPSDKANAIADCLEIQSTPHDLCDGNHERRVEARVQALLETVDNNPPQGIRPCDLQKLINFLKLRKAWELMAFQMNASGTFQGGHCFTYPIYSIIAFGSLIFKILGRKQSNNFT
jgi:hypothetical protein